MIRRFPRLNGSLDLLTLEDVLSEETLPILHPDPKVAGLQAPRAEDSPVSVLSFVAAPGSAKINSMAFALAAPIGSRGICNENMPPRVSPSCNEPVATRCSYKSSLPVRETLEMDVSMVDGTLRNLPLSDRDYMKPGVSRTSEKLVVVIDSRQVPLARGQALGYTRLDSKSQVSTSPATLVPSVSVKNRKRGNETPVASRRKEEEEEDRVDESEAQKTSEIVPSGLTLRIRQMGTNFSIHGRKETDCG
ncbi:hypothetical protein EYR41_007689 [Orbilia oligospora]|uniref:Uncharacterized protein n=1 Tax=Orbilia oligospora TaxID=2813651 RepID=A0A7C8KI84_ORBOL|nr:hypothetical protein TWF751_007069 [Orbilia oligospora]TGJ66029.1 hypothetical protein EYR41_007689 [Orbilia oligospora]